MHFHLAKDLAHAVVSKCAWLNTFQRCISIHGAGSWMLCSSDDLFCGVKPCLTLRPPPPLLFPHVTRDVQALAMSR